MMDNAARLLESAANVAEAGMGGGDWTVFIGPEGGVQMVAGAAESLESLVWSRGARAAWQIVNRGGSVRVEGWEAGQRCMLEAPKAGRRAERLLGDLRLYELAA
jgi:hypothetical protein